MGRQSRSIFWLNSHACLLHIAKLAKIANIIVVLYVITEMDVCWCDVMYILKHPYKEDFKLILRDAMTIFSAAIYIIINVM